MDSVRPIGICDTTQASDSLFWHAYYGLLDGKECVIIGEESWAPVPARDQFNQKFPFDASHTVVRFVYMGTWTHVPNEQEIDLAKAQLGVRKYKSVVVGRAPMSGLVNL